jgi:hypothetical protein
MTTVAVTIDRKLLKRAQRKAMIKFGPRSFSRYVRSTIVGDLQNSTVGRSSR